MTGPDAARTARHWNEMARGYDAAKARNAPYYDALKGLLVTWVPDAGERTVLDLGCGTGQILAHLRPRRGVGIDASERMIEIAGAAFAGREELTFRAAGAVEAPSLGPFDTVISADLLEHVPNWPEVVAAAAAACRHGGRIVLTTPNPAWAAPLWMLEKLCLKMPEGPHEFVHRGRIAAKLAALGCAVRYVGTHLILPVRLGGIGPALSRAAAAGPVLGELGVIQIVVAEKREPTR